METTSQKKFAIPLHMLFVHLFAFIYVDTIPISFHSLCFHHLNGFFYNQQPNCIFFFFSFNLAARTTQTNSFPYSLLLLHIIIIVYCMAWLFSLSLFFNYGCLHIFMQNETFVVGSLTFSIQKFAKRLASAMNAFFVGKKKLKQETPTTK